MHRRIRMALAALVAAQAAWLLVHWQPACVGPDAVGICAEAHQLATAGSGTFHPASPAQLVDSHWVQLGGNTYAGRYPPAYPFVLAFLDALFGPALSLLAGPLLAVLAVALLFAAARTMTDAAPAILGAALLATFPLANRLALHGDTHVPATVCVLLGLWALLRWDRRPTPAGAFLVGLAWGVLPTIRYAEGVMSAVAGGYVLWRSIRVREGGGRHILAAALGAAIPMGSLLLFDTATYGGPLTTGYAFTHEQTAFALANVGPNLRFYLENLARQPSVMGIVGLGMVGLVMMIRDRETRPRGVLLASMVAASTVVYSAYYWGGREDPRLAFRFFLPALVCLIPGIVGWVARARGRLRWAMVGAVSVQIAVGVSGSERSMRDEAVALTRAGDIVAAAEEAIPRGAVVIAPRALGETLEYENRWSLVPEWLLPGDPDRRTMLLPWEVPADVARRYAHTPAPTQIARGADIRSHYRGLSDRDLVRAVMTDIQHWRPGAGVYWIGDPNVVATADTLLATGRFEAIGKVLDPGGDRVNDAAAPYWVPRGPDWIFKLSAMP